MKQPTVVVQHVRVVRGNAFCLYIDSLAMRAGSVTCVAGPNGSGKSTLLACIVGLLQPDAGTVIVQGHAVDSDLRVAKAALGYIPDDEDWFVGELSAREYIALLAAIYKDAGTQGDSTKRAYGLAKKLQFTAFDQQLKSLSHGNKKKVQIIAGLMHRPQVIVIDELRNGLDPLAIIAAEQLIKDECTRGACIIAATHDVWWAERIASTILLLIDGQIAVTDTPKAIVRKYGSLEKLFMSTVHAA